MNVGSITESLTSLLPLSAPGCTTFTWSWTCKEVGPQPDLKEDRMHSSLKASSRRCKLAILDSNSFLSVALWLVLCHMDLKIAPLHSEPCVSASDIAKLHICYRRRLQQVSILLALCFQFEARVPLCFGRQGCLAPHFGEVLTSSCLSFLWTVI